MPTYQFKDSETEEVHSRFMKYEEKLQYLKDNPNLQSIIGTPLIVSGVGEKIKGVSNLHRDVISEIKKNHPKNTIRDH